MALMQENKKFKGFSFCVLWKVSIVLETLSVHQERKERVKRKKISNK